MPGLKMWINNIWLKVWINNTVSVLNVILCELQLLNPLLTILENSAIILGIEIMSIYYISLLYAYSQYIIHCIISYDL